MPVIQGEEFDALREEVEQERVDTVKVRQLLGDRVGEVLKVISFYKMSISRKDKSKSPTFIPPNLSNYTNAGLIDHLGKVREQIKLLEKEEGILKAALDARLAKEASKEFTKDLPTSPTAFQSV